jgi:hypothetical protein
VNKKSKDRSYQFIYSTNIILVNSNNFLDAKGNHPLEDTPINGKDVVFERDKLSDGKWLFCIDNKDIVEEAKKQIRDMIRHDVWLIIQNKSPFNNRKFVYHNIYKDEVIIDDIESELIRKKYLNLEECKKQHEKIPNTILDAFKDGDEIWFYNTSARPDECYSRTEALILIRGNKVICSPAILVCLADSF